MHDPHPEIDEIIRDGQDCLKSERYIEEFADAIEDMEESQTESRVSVN
jgi:hypothetical protein